MRLDSMLGCLGARVVLAALVAACGCVVPESVGNRDTDVMATTGDTEATDDDTGTTDGETGSALECFGIADEASCLAAGCSEFDTVLQVSDTCECTPGVAACLLFTGGIGGAASPDFFWHEATGTVVMFDMSWIELPVGWRRCTDADAPAACGCYEPFMAPQCP